MLTSQKQSCPYCGELIELTVDLSIESQEYIEDCFVCCRPIVVNVNTPDGCIAHITLRAENE